MIRPVPRLIALVLLGMAALAGCGAEPLPEPGTDEAARPAGPPVPPGRVFERGVVFLGAAGDSTLTVPWIFTAHTRPGVVERRARAWLARGGAWEPFVDESWETAPTRVPWRVHPHGALRLIVGEGETLDGLAFAEGARSLEVAIGAPRVVWDGAQGETFLVADGSVVLAERRVPGLVLDLARAHRGDAPAAGDWMFLVSGDSVQMVLNGIGVPGSEEGATVEAWGRLQDGTEIPWRDLAVSWVETRAFERARREVPVRWQVGAADGSMEAELEVRTAHIEAGAGDGPILPVEALFEVAGTLRVANASYPVRGLVRHVQR